MPAGENAVHLVPDADDEVLAVSWHVIIQQPRQAGDDSIAVRQQIDG